MGRKRHYPTTKGSIVGEASVGDEAGKQQVDRAIEERIGLHNSICMDCNANNAENAEECRKCGGDVRRKKSEFSDA